MTNHPDLLDLSKILENWGIHGKPLVPRPKRSFQPISLLISAASDFLSYKLMELQSVLTRSNAIFSPLSDPLAMDLGVHRWLQGQREERYSDWLHWVIHQISEPADLFSVLGMDRSDIPIPATKKPSVKCEDLVEKGHEDHTGRLDLRILFPGELIIVIECKICGGGDVIKNKGYIQSVRKKYRKERKHFIFLTPSPDDNPNVDLEDIKFEKLLWTEVCLNLRQFVSMKINCESLNKLAMILAFVGAIEQNCLGLSATDQMIMNPMLINSATLDHLRKFVGRNPNGRK